MTRPPGPEPHRFARAARVLALLLACASAPAGQYGTIQREQKICSRTGGFTGPISNDYRFGVSVAELGDFDGDGIRDLAVGSHRANIGGEEPLKSTQGIRAKVVEWVRGRERPVDSPAK